MARIHEYIDERNGGLYVAGTRIPLECVVGSYQRGNSPEGIQEEYGLLKLWQIHGALAYYLEHRAKVDEYMEKCRRDFYEAEASAIPLKESNPGLWERLERARQEMATKKS